MKRKLIGMLSVVILTLILILCFASCSIIGGASWTWRKIESAMNDLESYETEMDMDMTFYVGEKECTAKGSSTVVATGIGKPDFFYIDDSKTSVEIEGAEKIDPVRTVTGYKEGECYLLTSVKSIEYRQMRTAMTPTEFQEYISSESIDSSDFTDCETIEYTKNEDGTHTLRFSDYSAEQLDTYCSALGFDDLSKDIKMSSLVVTVNANEDYLVTDIKFEPVFDKDEDGNTPSLKMEMKYKNHNSARSANAALDSKNYTAVESFKPINEIQDMIDAISEKESGEFVLSTKQSVKIAGETSSSSEKDTVVYGTKSNDFFYDITAKINNQEVLIYYSDGNQTVTVGSQETTTEQSEKEAKQYIDQLIGSHGFQESYVSNILEAGDGTYKFEVSVPNTSAYEQVYSALSGTMNRGLLTNTVTFTVKDGSIVEAESKIVTNGTISKGYSAIYEIEITFSTTITYK